jgi:hypothetical protein
VLYNGQAMGGEKCEVTAGANKGKTGTFTEGGTWCEGSWGGTECTDQQGNSKCKAAAVVVVDDGGTVIDGNDGVVIITTGFYRTPDRGLVRCTTSTGARTSAVCFPTAVDKLEELKVRIAIGVERLIANHLHLAIFESTLEVRVLPSAGITRPQRSYDRRLEAATLAHDGSPPITRTTFPTCRAHYPGGSGSGWGQTENNWF